MIILQPNDQLGAKVDGGSNEIAAHVNGLDETQSTGLRVGVTSADALFLSTTAAALVATPSAGHHYLIPLCSFKNTGSTTRRVTVYLERNDASPEYAAANIWHEADIAAAEKLSYENGQWVVYDASGVPKYASAPWPTIPEGATPPTPPTGYIRPFAKTNGRMAQVDDLGLVSEFIESARHVNFIINGEFDYWQRLTPGSANTISNTSGRTFGADRFGITNENASVTCQRVDAAGAAETGLNSRFYARFDKITSAGKVVISQVIEAGNCIHLRGKQVRVQMKLKANTSLTLRMAVLQLTAAGTLDTMPATFISAFGANSTDPTLGTNLSKVAPDAGSAETATIVNNALNCAVTTAWQRFGAAFTLPTDFKNLVVCVWSDSQVATTDDFEVAEVSICDGPEIREWTPRPQSDQLANCQRYYTKSFAVDSAPVQNFGQAGSIHGIAGKAGATALGGCIQVTFPTRMRATPTITGYCPTEVSAHVDRISGTTPIAHTATAQLDANDLGVTFTSTGTANTAVGDQIAVHYSADAEI